ncbi:hypothetical protein Ae201684_017429 [Aphanomyces euteiches]|uniref:Uncharacterized protein n=1 Tax=Aphanomyces euteiches TaxID=100861 RepID=A0A6G0WA63_9STRA|nr:hypothetical protein Ae201684_017429 [Aphanomyces euteiches]
MMTSLFKPRGKRYKDMNRAELAQELFQCLDADEENVELVKLLLLDEDAVHSYDENGNRPLHCATSRGYLNSVNELLSAGARVNMKNKRNEAALHIAAEKGYIDIVNILLLSKASVDIKNENRETPLHLACLKGYLEVAEALLGKNVSVEAENNKGKNALDLASSRGFLEIATKLLEFSTAIKKLDELKAKALYLASKEGHLKVVIELLKHCANPNIKNQENTGADVDLADNDECTALCWAAHNDHCGIAYTLLSRGASVNKPDMEGQQPLHWAARFKYIDMLKLLLDYEAKVNAQCRVSLKIDHNQANFHQKGYTALHWASDRGHFQIVRELLARGADDNIRDKYGETPLKLASNNGNLDIFELLFNAKAEANLAKKVEAPMSVQQAIESIRSEMTDIEKSCLEYISIAISIGILVIYFPILRQNVLKLVLWLHGLFPAFYNPRQMLACKHFIPRWKP